MYAALLAAALVIVVGFLTYYRQGSSPVGTNLPSQAQWDAALASTSGKTLFGTIVSVKGSSVVIVAQQPTLGTTSVVIGSSTPVIKNIPLHQDELAAAYKEFLRLQKEANGKPFDPPNTYKTTVLTKADLRAGDTVLVTLAENSSKDAFEAESIEVLPLVAPSAPPPAPGL